MKVKGYELLEMAVNGKIKDNTIVEVTSYNDRYIFVCDTFWEYDKNYGRTNYELSASVLIANDFEILEDNTEEIEEMLINGREVELGSMSEWLGETSLHEEKISSAIDCIGITLNEVIRAVNKLTKESDKNE